MREDLGRTEPSQGPWDRSGETLLGFAVYCHQRRALALEQVFPDAPAALRYLEEHQQQSVSPLCRDDFLVKVYRMEEYRPS